MSVPVTMTLAGKQITVSVAASGKSPAAQGEVWICSVSKAVPIMIGRGENRGREDHLSQCGAHPAQGR